MRAHFTLSLHMIMGHRLTVGSVISLQRIQGRPNIEIDYDNAE